MVRQFCLIIHAYHRQSVVWPNQAWTVIFGLCCALYSGTLILLYFGILPLARTQGFTHDSKIVPKFVTKQQVWYSPGAEYKKYQRPHQRPRGGSELAGKRKVKKSRKFGIGRERLGTSGVWGSALIKEKQLLCNCFWKWTQLGLNQRPPDYESGAANQLSYGSRTFVFLKNPKIHLEAFVVDRRIELLFKD